MAVLFFRFEDGEPKKIKGAGWMPTVVRSIHTDEEDTFEFIRITFAFTMQAGDMARHDVTSREME
jgi:hypothetical protein